MRDPSDTSAYGRRRTRILAAIVALGLLATWAAARWLDPLPPRRIVLAAADSAIEQQWATRYVEQLAQDGVAVEVRTTSGAADNVGLLLDAQSGVDAAFVQGGLVSKPSASGLEMIASLHYAPLWVFHRADESASRLNQFRGRRIAIGAPGSGTRGFADPLLRANDVTEANSTLLPLAGSDAIVALRGGTADAAIVLALARDPAIQAALRDSSLRAMSFARAGAYERRFPHVTRLALPPGSIDFGANIPDREVTLIGTELMLAARESIHPAIVNLLLDAAHAIHGGQGIFERAGEFPNLNPVDLPVSEQARHHQKFGPGVLHRYLPFWVATVVERAILIVLPVLLVVLPLASRLPALLRWRTRARIFRWYGELALLERDVAARGAPLPVSDWLATLDRIGRAAENVKVPPSFAAEAYTLREHVELVRRTVLAKAAANSRADAADRR